MNKPELAAAEEPERADTSLDLLPFVLKALKTPAAQAQLRHMIAALKSSAETTEPLLTTAEAAPLLGMTPNALRQAAYRGTVVCERLGRRLRFRRSQLLP